MALHLCEPVGCFRLCGWLKVLALQRPLHGIAYDCHWRGAL